MELIRRDTDYAFRLVAKLAAAYGGEEAFSARALAKETQVSYALACKILQKLAHEGIVNSIMGPKGGWQLAKKPGQIQFRDVIEAVQGPVSVNRCLMVDFKCPLKKQCPAHPKMVQLQSEIIGFLDNLTLNEFVEG